MNARLSSFENHLPRRVISGRGASESLVELCRANGWQRVFLVSDAGVAGAGLMRKVSQPLLDVHLLADTFAEVPPEPPIDVVDKIAERIKASGADVGALVEQAVAAGARIVCENRSYESDATLHEGSFFPPTVLTGVSDEMRVAQEEIFGPVIPLLRYTSVSDAVRRANETPYGLASYVYGRDLAQCRAVASAIEAGIVGVNEWRPLKAEIPFGGIKQSGIGAEGGEEGLREFLETQVISMPKPVIAS